MMKMLQNNLESTSYRRSITSTLSDRQVVINTIAKESVYLDRSIKNLEYQFEYMDQIRKEHSDIFSNPFLMLKLETALINAYALRKCYDSELKLQSGK